MEKKHVSITIGTYSKLRFLNAFREVVYYIGIINYIIFVRFNESQCKTIFMELDKLETVLDTQTYNFMNLGKKSK